MNEAINIIDMLVGCDCSSSNRRINRCKVVVCMAAVPTTKQKRILNSTGLLLPYHYFRKYSAGVAGYRGYSTIMSPRY